LLKNFSNEEKRAITRNDEFIFRFEAVQEAMLRGGIIEIATTMERLNGTIGALARDLRASQSQNSYGTADEPILSGSKSSARSTKPKTSTKAKADKVVPLTFDEPTVTTIVSKSKPKKTPTTSRSKKTESNDEGPIIRPFTSIFGF
jgi:hypothetical protein